MHLPIDFPAQRARQTTLVFRCKMLLDARHATHVQSATIHNINRRAKTQGLNKVDTLLYQARALSFPFEHNGPAINVNNRFDSSRVAINRISMHRVHHPDHSDSCLRSINCTDDLKLMLFEP
jgi:hypothetical protein